MPEILLQACQQYLPKLAVQKVFESQNVLAYFCFGCLSFCSKSEDVLTLSLLSCRATIAQGRWAVSLLIWCEHSLIAQRGPSVHPSLVPTVNTACSCLVLSQLHRCALPTCGTDYILVLQHVKSCFIYTFCLQVTFPFLEERACRISICPLKLLSCLLSDCFNLNTSLVLNKRTMDSHLLCKWRE